MTNASCPMPSRWAVALVALASAAGCARAGTVPETGDRLGTHARAHLRRLARGAGRPSPAWRRVLSRLSPEQQCDALDDLFRFRPVGEGQLFRALKQLKIPQIPYYPTRAHLQKQLLLSASLYAGIPRENMDEPNRYISTAAKWGPQLVGAINGTLGRPVRFLVEVGTFVGKGAVKTFGPYVQSAGPDALMLCIDTWQGDVAMHLIRGFDQYLGREHSMPTLGMTFLKNVVAHNLTRVVYPLAMPSLTAARLLAVLNWRADVIYIDSAHEEGETLVELHMYYRLLAEGGVLAGDDYGLFPAVKHDVDLFVRCRGLHLQRVRGQPRDWVIKKRPTPLPPTRATSATSSAPAEQHMHARR